MMERMLVTGATGFVGGHLVPELVRSGHVVRCLVRPTSRIDSLRPHDVELATGDINDTDFLRRTLAGADVVFHLAGVVEATDAAGLRRVNVDGTHLLARLCAAQPTPPTLVLVSSIAASGPARRGHVRRESDPPHPVSEYGISKRAGELAAARWARHLPITVVRPGIVFGPGDRALWRMLMCLKRFHLHAVAGYLTPPLSLIQVHDLVQLLQRAVRHGQRLRPATSHRNSGAVDSEGYYFACTSEYPDYLQLGRMLRDAIGQRLAVMLAVPSPFPFLIAGANELVARLRRKPDVFCTDKIREALVDSWACSSAAAQRDLGFQPAAPLASQLEATVAWYRQAGWI